MREKSKRGRPRLEAGMETKRLVVLLPASLHDLLAEEAASVEMKRSTLARQLIADALDYPRRPVATAEPSEDREDRDKVEQALDRLAAMCRLDPATFRANLRANLCAPPKTGHPAPLGSRWRHVKRRTDYTVIGHCAVQASTAGTEIDGEPAVIYIDADRAIYVRALAEFWDGRFQRLEGVCE